MNRIYLARRHSQRGAALVILLAFVLLLSAVVVAYLNRAMFSNRLSNSSLNRTEAEQLALSATEIIIGDLKQEIVNGSIASASDSRATIYRPKRPINIIPARRAPATIPNLVRQSGDDPPPPAISSRASPISSTTESSNGRSISLARWNSHYLIPRSSSAQPTDTEPVPQFSPPDWVIVSSDVGPTGDPPDPSRVVGRYAYAIYDEGGLLDVNVAGYPTNATANQYANKPALAYADLSTLSADGLSDAAINNLVGWRNYATAKPNGSFNNFSFGKTATENFFNSVINNTNGFLRVSAVTRNGQTDQTFLSRQQLIDYSLKAGWGHAVSTLQYFGTFSREVNAPTWNPSTPTPTNPSLLNIRVKQEFVRLDGTTAQVGEPLLKERFPLSRLAGLGFSGIVTNRSTTLVNGAPAQASATTIQRDFGLIWKGDHWDYFESRIRKIGEIGGREPNFFELLKAGIFSTSVDPEIIRIGANIIDQYDADNYPTEIRFGNPIAAYYGIENLPYAYSELLDDGSVSARVWYPHQNLGNSTIPPTKFRFRATKEPGNFVEIEDIPGEYPIDNDDIVLEYEHLASKHGYREYHRISNLTGEKEADPRADRLNKMSLSGESIDHQPIILNRPFRNVGELGYVFRNPPWKNIDFFTENSPDVGLLEIFCVQETTDENALVAGKINLNTRQAPVLKAILAGAMVSETDLTTMSPVDAQRIATELVAFTDKVPFLNRSQLVIKASTILKNRIQEKNKGEAALRALSEISKTRTWNLMIDVIAQSGRYGPGQTDLSKFIVEGERRYWVHVAIDRFTGKVVDKFMEAVYE